ncbi:MAG: hypothetical protein WD270_10800 [Acetobacterales bacterium]
MNKVSDTPKIPEFPEIPYADAASTIGAALLDSMVQASQSCMEGMAAAGEESTRFLGLRVNNDMRCFAEMSECRSLEDLTRIQQEWLSTTMKDYGEAWLRMTAVFTVSGTQKGKP